MATTADLLNSLLIGYCVSVLIETPVLLLGLSPRHSTWRRLCAGFWLTACTYPIVCLVLPAVIPAPRSLYLVVAETFAPAAECVLFWMAFVQSSGVWIGRCCVISRRSRQRIWLRSWR